MQAQLPELSAQDVRLLHEIVLRAQEAAYHHSQPFKALLESHETVFAEHGLDPNQDPVCFRLLFQIAGPGVKGESLYEKFEHVLEQAGIGLTFEDDAASQDDQPGEDRYGELSEEAGNLGISPRKPDRRNSFTSLYDATADVRRSEKVRRPSWGSEAAAQNGSKRVYGEIGALPIHLRTVRTGAFARGRPPPRTIESRAPQPIVQPSRSFADPSGHFASHLPRNDDFQARRYAAQIMEQAIQKDRLALLQQAFANWRRGARVGKERRRLVQSEIALQAQREHVQAQRKHIARIADAHYENRLILKAFPHWIYTALNAKDKSDAARLWYLRHKFFMGWQRLTVQLDRDAESFRTRSIFQRVLTRCKQRLSNYRELEERAQKMQNLRVARTFFDRWYIRSRQLAKAESEFKRHSMGYWFKCLRYGYAFKRVRATNEERIAAENLYWWIVEVRCSQFAKKGHNIGSRRVLNDLLRNYREQQKVFLARESQIIEQRNARLLKSTLECWKLQMNLQGERSRMALEFYNPRIELENLVIWQARVKYIQRQELRALDLMEYFLTNKTLKRWHVASIESKRARMNDTYKQTRRIIKIGLLRRALATWHARLEDIAAMQEQSLVKHDQKLKALVQRIFVKWQIGTSQVQQKTHQSSAHYENSLMKTTFQALVDALRQKRRFEGQADQFYQIRLSDICLAQLKRMSMKAFEMKRRQQDADAMRQRHFAKNVRIMLRHWNSKAGDVTLLPHKPSPLSVEREPTDQGYATGTGTATLAGSTTENPPNVNTTSGISGATQRAEEWTAFDQDLLEVNTTPGYLKTPSKRAARVRALVSATSTTPATPWMAQLGRSRFGPSSRTHLFRDLD